MSYIPEHIKALIADKRAEGRADIEANRAAVLRHPELAARLTMPPLDYERPDQWSGYIPPSLWNGAINTCDRRRALVELVTEALTRDEQRTGREAAR